ncbi:MAG: NINE protein, partial [Saprospiraceae bacterium]|nr:NINE protein [Saprospiraceae bacterium]
MTSKRQLAAIMFTDIAGFSAMMHDNEGYAKTILARQRQTLESTHRDFGGKILQYIGDGTLSIFRSAVEAVECAVNMQVELRKAPYVPLRIGIHTGDITYDETGAFGDGVNITSRVEELCVPGGVFITEKVYDDIRNHAWLSAMPLGPYDLHNIETRIHVYAVTSKGLPVPDRNRLNVSPERDVDYPAAGLKNKFTAAILALFLGMFGAHRFYLGQRKKGILYLVAFGVAMAAAIEENAPIIAILAIIAFVDSVLLFVMPKAEFDQKYNQMAPGATRQRKRTQPIKERTPKENRSAVSEVFRK